jgi:hypothetical protein
MYSDEADEKRVQLAAQHLTPTMWQFYEEARPKKPGGQLRITDLDEDNERKTRTVNDACIFLNRKGHEAPGFTGSFGCVLHHLAQNENSGWTMNLSKKLKPDEAFFNVQTNSLHIIEKKAQTGSGSVDEKLQTFPFKIRQYKRLVEGLEVNGKSIDVHYVYCLHRFFQKSEYKDLFDYMDEEGMTYFIQNADGSLKLPLSLIGLKD